MCLMHIVKYIDNNYKMFYTLTTKLIIKKTGSNRDYLYIYLIGTVCYIVVHWYLNMEQRDGIVGKVADYFYYLLIADLVTAYIMYRMTAIQKPEHYEENNEKHENDEVPLTAEQKKIIMQRMHEARRLQLMRLKEAEQKDTQPSPPPPPPKAQTNEQTSSEKRDPKKSIFSKSGTQNVKDKVTESKEKKEESVNDTEIPVFKEAT